MKKLFLLIVTAILILSCASKTDEIPANTPEETNETKDLVIGTWVLIKKSEIAITDDCEKKDTYIFNEDASYTFDDYNTKSGSCIKDETDSFKGTWKNNKNNTYNIKKHGYTGNGADLNINFTENNQYLTFSNNGLTYKRK